MDIGNNLSINYFSKTRSSIIITPSIAVFITSLSFIIRGSWRTRTTIFHKIYTL